MLTPQREPTDKELKHEFRISIITSVVWSIVVIFAICAFVFMYKNNERWRDESCVETCGGVGKIADVSDYSCDCKD